MEVVQSSPPVSWRRIAHVLQQLIVYLGFVLIGRLRSRERSNELIGDLGMNVQRVNLYSFRL